jgi:hypothetical protein
VTMQSVQPYIGNDVLAEAIVTVLCSVRALRQLLSVLLPNITSLMLSAGSTILKLALV